MFLSSVVYCCWIDIPLTMIVLTIGPLFAAAITLMGRLTSKYSQNMMKTSGKINEIIEEAVMNVKTVASCNSQRHMVEGLTFEAKAGETIGLVGQSGCGKSTTIALITKLYSPTSGSIQIDGAGISSHDMKCLRKSIGIVQQEPCLFNGTIRENIGLGRSVTDEEIENAARMANAHEFISSLEKGYDTELGPGGIALSGGQKQRIAIARAIVTDPKILLLDEATSALDSTSEKTVQDALNKATKGRTTIVIAHRLSILRDADRIYLIENGKVKEAGSHEELLKADGTYANMARAQEVNRDRSRKSDEEADGKDDFITNFGAISYAKVPAWRVMYAAPHIQSLSKSNGAATELMTLLNDDKHLIVDINKGLKPEIIGDVQVSAAKFSYPSRSNFNVTRGLSIRARKGEDVALVGASGCGKSTVVSLLERFYDLKGGEITIDSIPIRDISIEHLRNNMALVSQEPTLFSGTIIENITMGCPSATLKDVMQACRIANASSFIESFPLAYETDVGEKGGNFSGGQKQRIAIARALVRNPKILLLDEATSALDPVAEEAIQMALKEAAKGRTTITIAHRLKSIQHCDRICYIENGKTVECGTHAELLNLNGKYNQLIKDQVLDPK
ncbi:hypothetical protein WR25_08358 [Diploscapter pachys]|uniref:ABC transporter domain-containing protein n=1 Tax=Diploscapter pachys TaxID=2018661 RepID=A0A2A2KH14_9BILA|nr:hypothetical protein WR25_08358 [Diploscapter pachys]